MAIFVAIDGPPDQVWQTMTATDGPALPQVVPLSCIFLKLFCGFDRMLKQNHACTENST